LGESDPIGATRVKDGGLTQMLGGAFQKEKMDDAPEIRLE
jgi:hypothetical protein